MNHREATTTVAGEPKSVEEAQREQEAGFHLLFANNPLPMWVYDLETLRFLEINEAAIVKYGYSRDEFQAMTIADIRPSEDIARLVDHVAQERPNLQFSGAWRHRLKDGRIIAVEISSHRLVFAGRSAALVVAQDITDRLRAEEERWRAEEERRRLQDEVIRAQQALLAELSTPLFPINEQVVVMPLIGAIDSQRAQQVITTLLHGLEKNQARVAILDITGVPMVDTQVANALIRAAYAARMLGAEVVLTGIRPEVAQTLVSLGLSLQGITTAASLRDGIAGALSRQR